MSSVRYFVEQTRTESFQYDPAEIERLWEALGAAVPAELLRGDEETSHESRVVALFTALDGSLVSPFTSRENYDAGYTLSSEDEDGSPVSAGGTVRVLERGAAEPQGELVGIVDEYGSVWADEPGASKRIGDLVPRPDEETSSLYLDAADKHPQMTLIGYAVVEPTGLGDFDYMLGTPLFEPDDRESADACLSGDAVIAEVWRA